MTARATPPMKKVAHSEAIEAYGYDAASRELYVQYRGGTRYVFHNVAPEDHEALSTCGSIGRFINASIKERHHFTKLGEPGR